MEVGIRALKQNLSRYIALIRSGETVTVTDRGKPVARLEPVQTTQPPDSLRQLVAAGKLSWKPPLRRHRPSLGLSAGGKTFSDLVLDERR